MPPPMCVCKGWEQTLGGFFDLEKVKKIFVTDFSAIGNELGVHESRSNVEGELKLSFSFTFQQPQQRNTHSKKKSQAGVVF